VTARRVTEAQIAAYVRELRGRPNGRVVALRGAPEWTGPQVIQVDERPVRVAACSSALAVRQALAGAGDGASTLVVLTDRTEQDLGDDVLGRLAKQRVIVPDMWDVLANAFGATAVDPRLAAHPWLVDGVLEVTAGHDRPVVPGRALGFEFVLSTLLGRLGLPAPVDLQGLLTWTADPSRLHGYLGAPEAVQLGVERVLTDDLGPVAGHALRMVRQGADALVVPVGLVCRVVFPETPTAESGKAVGGLEQGHLHGSPLTVDLARRWAEASEAVVRQLLAAGDPAAEPILDGAEQLVARLGAAGLAGTSDVLRAGLERRLEAFAEALDDPSGRDEALALVERHSLAEGGGRRRVEAARMAARLMRWPRVGSLKGNPTFSEACTWYQDEGGWLDRARASLWSTDSNPRVAGRYARLSSELDELRGHMNIDFARLLKDWLSGPSTDEGIVPVESIIDRVVAPLAAAAPVLMLVMDGMSMAVFRELTTGMVREGFREITPDGVTARRPAVAVVPSVTEVCRTSLLSGYLTGGNQGRERRRFEAHPALLGAGKGGGQPRMWHKADLVQDDGRSLAAGVEDTIANPQQRVAGAVLNVIDDQLMKGDQLASEFTPATIPLLHRLLTAARQAGRVVVLVSDHGHVFERGLEFRKPAGGGGERWRNGDDPRDDEVLLRGDRVLLGDGQVIAAATEWVRYAPKRNGYHGGATPQEMLVPLSVWAPSLQQVPGWVDLIEAPPAWWAPPQHAAPLPPVPGPGPAPAKTRQPEGQGRLFEPQHAALAPAHANGGWIDRLIASPVFAAQVVQAGRGVDEARLRPVLSVLDARGGRAPLDLVARSAGVPLVRASGLISQVSRILNIDGYPIIGVSPSGDEVVLNRDQLLAQFGV
jgi:hypothetical protein